ncbi:MAG: hypothetical protein IPO15_20910 [Anaerolineae bacterium]|uniref:hypothetical protein n=1 Tax=Candidatus Amarolinea dominans TaxID=3140696 RepID=UPI00313545C6|nr:hypothetical protein [Anaerolineae bacterium]
MSFGLIATLLAVLSPSPALAQDTAPTTPTLLEVRNEAGALQAALVPDARNNCRSPQRSPP